MELVTPLIDASALLGKVSSEIYQFRRNMLKSRLLNETCQCSQQCTRGLKTVN